MTKNRMEAFSDGILAIIITVMVLKLNVPKDFTIASIKEILPTLFAYVISYLYIGIYWTNHHHLISTIKHVSGRILWQNLHWLFWMSLIPIATEWTGLNPLAKIPTFFYGIILFMCAVSYHILQVSIIRIKGKDSLLAKSIGKDLKGKSSMLAYAIGIISSLYFPVIAYIFYIGTAVLWIVPDIRVESILSDNSNY